jgi:leucyl aminopeptidase (aminopeptidase T)
MRQPVSEPAGRGAAWTEERETSDEGRRRLKAPRQLAGEQSTSDEGRRRLKAPRQLAGQQSYGSLLDQCLGVRAGEQVVLLTDAGTDPDVVSRLLESVAARDGVPLVARMPAPYLPGAEPPGAVAAMMLAAGAVIELTSLFIGSSRARRDATGRGVRYLAMPGVRDDTFRSGGPLDVDFEQLRADAETVGRAWGAAATFRLSTPGGTDLRGSVEGRPGRVLHGMAREPGAYMAPPDIESGTAPVEGSASGVVVIDGDLLFMGEGPLREPVVLHVSDGQVVGIEGAERGRLTQMMERCADDQMTNLAEVSVAFNPNGTICAVPMETESARGTAHIALGNSIAYGGVVNAVAHLDCVMRDATLELDGRLVMSQGSVP